MKVGPWIMPTTFMLYAVASAYAAASTQGSSEEEDSTITITIVYDNNSSRPDLRAAWGFACFIEGLEKTILFDTGGDGRILLSNMEKLGISPKKVEVIVLSHIHGDHTGGLAAVLERNPDVSVFLPASFPGRMKAAIAKTKARVVEVKDPREVCAKAFSTGEMGTFVKEQSLYLRGKEGVAVITGCAHPGVVKIVSRAKELSKSQPFLVLGGFHMAGSPDSNIKSVIRDLKELGVVKAGPCHCSGDRTRELFAEAFGGQYIKAEVGSVIKLDGAR
jgi:7,8-dihydropterin-6-yl-methyl-4-(beta-D-ribofuranosyl)aminobenzene 5'-phosphate synthase